MENISIVKVKGIRGITDQQLVSKLTEVYETLDKMDCTFWGCRGPQKLEKMITCSKCWSMREIAKTIKSLQIRGR